MVEFKHPLVDPNDKSKVYYSRSTVYRDRQTGNLIIQPINNSALSSWDNGPVSLPVLEATTPEELVNEINRIAFANPTGDLDPANDTSICFIDSSFPSLLLTRIKDSNDDIPYKRVTKIEKANKIVTDNQDTWYRHIFDYGIKMVCRTIDGRVFISTSSLSSTTHDSYICISSDDRESIALWEGEFKRNFKNIKSISYIMFINPGALGLYASKKTMADNSSMYVSTEKFTRSVWSYMPEMTPDEYDTIYKYLKSSNKDNRNIGFQTLQYLNFKKYIPNLINIVMEYNGESTSASAHFFKYLARFDRLNKYRDDNMYPWYNATKDSDLYTDEEKANRELTQTIAVLQSVIDKYNDSLKALNIHVEYKGINGNCRTIESYRGDLDGCSGRHEVVEQSATTTGDMPS